jgi:hypothetical protein
MNVSVGMAIERIVRGREGTKWLDNVTSLTKWIRVPPSPTAWKCPDGCRSCGVADTCHICLCHGAKYCCVECRDIDWSAHKSQCPTHIEKKLRRIQNDICQVVDVGGSYVKAIALLEDLLRIAADREDHPTLMRCTEELLVVSGAAVEALRCNGAQSGGVTMIRLQAAQVSRFLAHKLFM